jgi:hypothetical protein
MNGLAPLYEIELQMLTFKRILDVVGTLVRSDLSLE